MIGKKGKIATVPMLVVGLLLITLVYGYFLPLSDKCLLLPNLDECTGASKEVLLNETPGVLEPTNTAARYSFENVQLFRRDSLEIDTVFDEVKIRKSWFTSIHAKTEFNIQEGGRDVKLFVVVNDARGRLKVKVNGKTVAKISGEGLHQVSLPLGLLKEVNTIQLKSATPWLPFIVNRHSIGKVSLREEYTITHNRISREFNLDQNPEEVDRALLRFETNCFYEDNLSVFVNGEEIFDGRICEGFEKDVAEYLEEENEITFASDGNYYIEDVRLDVGMKQKSWLTYYFDVPEKRFDQGFIYLKMKFGEVGDKKLTLYLNGEALSVETIHTDFETTINKYLEEGQNSLILIPETALTLEKVEVI